MATTEEETEYCLRWNNHHQALVSVLETLLMKETLVDVILTAEGQSIKVHRIVLFACSQYFTELLSGQGDKLAVVYLKDVSFTVLKSLVEFMYRGEVNISHCQFENFLHTAEALQIRGLSDRSSQKVLVPNLLAHAQMNEKVPVHYSYHPTFTAEAQSEPPRPPRLARPKPYEKPDHIKADSTVAYSSSSSPRDVDSESNLVIDHPDNEEIHSDQESIRYEEEEMWNRPYPQKPKLKSREHASIGSMITNKDNANESWLSEHGANAPPEMNYDHMSDSSQGAEGPVPEPTIIEDPDGSDRPFVCPRCNRRYKRKNNAVAHLRYECGVVPSFPCPICSHMLSQRRYIQKHIRRKHPDYIQDFQDYKEKKYSVSADEVDVKPSIST